MACSIKRIEFKSFFICIMGLMACNVYGIEPKQYYE